MIKNECFFLPFFAQQVKQSGVPYKNILIYIQHLAARATNTIIITHWSSTQERERERKREEK